jgi:hypothetical protein
MQEVRPGRSFNRYLIKLDCALADFGFRTASITHLLDRIEHHPLALWQLQF